MNQLHVAPLAVRSNFILLVAAFGVGQGSIFIAQTYLLGVGQAGLLGQFGTAFTILVLIQQLIDFGGNVTLARVTASANETNLLRDSFSGLVLVRLCAFILIGTAIVLYSSIAGRSLISNYFVWALPGLAAVILNPIGVLDGLRLSGLSGLTSSLVYVASAAVLPFAAKMGGVSAGTLLGCAFTVAQLSSVAAQHGILNRCGVHVLRLRSSKPRVSQMFLDGLQYLLSWTPSQLLLRFQLLLIGHVFGSASAGVFVYVKQFVSGTLQLTHFIRRAEFPRLVSFASDLNSGQSAFRLQKWSYVGSSLAAVGLLVAGAVAARFGSPEFAEAGRLAMIYSALPVASNLLSNFTQVCYASKNMRPPVIASLFLLAGTVVLSWAAIRPFGLPSIAVVEILMNLGAALLLAALMKRIGTWRRS